MRTQKQILKSFTLVLVCVLVVLTATPAINFGGRDADESNSRLPSLGISVQSRDIDQQIATLNQRAEEIARENQARESRLNELRADQARQNEFIQTVNTQIAEIQSQVDAYNQLINAKQESIDYTQAQIKLKQEEAENTERRIEQRERQIEQLDAQNQESLKQFGEIVAQMYMNSGGGSLGLFSGSSSFADIMIHAEMLRNIGEHNAQIIANLLESVTLQEEAIVELEEDIVELNYQRAILDIERALLQDELAELETTKDGVSAEVNRQRNVLSGLTAERDDLQNDINALGSLFNASEAEIAEINRQIESIIRAEEERIRRAEEAARAAAAAAGQPAPPPSINHAAGGFRWPLEGRFTRVTSGFGHCSWRRGWHNGTDIAGPGINGSPIFAMQSGTVIRSGRLGTFGYVVFINHGGGYVTVYAHMIRQPPVSEGQTVTQGQVIGHVGSTGRSTGPHLHFEVRRNGTAVNPMSFFR
ncbi:MAG: peptidoglycan DD-metalloendopeptidase family protein [Oscillospiraceae bacterium]|nr:peptidoglycan DD-metalloendopeptidase family protein [Oscillospiraceae bacterium]